LSEALEDAGRMLPGTATEKLRLPGDQQNSSCIPRPQPQATALLSQVLAYLRGIDVPVLQFVQVSENGATSGVARSFADASLAWLGRTLLVSLGNTPPSALQPSGGKETVPFTDRRQATKPLADQTNIVPDAEVPELYYARIGPAVTEAIAASRVQPSVWLGEARSNFRFLIIDCGSFAGNPVAVELASRCHGSILTVCAAHTTLVEVRAASRQLRLAGGRLLGSVLYNARPSNMPLLKPNKPATQAAMCKSR
jgi:hypothetical protein